MGDDKYPRLPMNEAKAVASNGSGTAGVRDVGDMVTIYFSGSTNGPGIDDTNIGTVLALPAGRSWGTSITAAWSDTGGKSNNVLSITIGTGATITAGDSISFDLLTIKDTSVSSNPYRGKMTLKGGF